MKKRVSLEWSDKAKAEILGIKRYYKDKNPEAGRRIINEIRTQAFDIEENPFIGLNTSKKGVQRLLIAKTTYFLPYRLKPNEENPKTAYILSVVSSLEDSKARKYL